jgi:hypothetical protein
MAAAADLLQAIATLGQTFPQYVQREIARLTDEFVGSVQSFTNPLAQAGGLSLQSLMAQVASLTQGNVLGDVAQVAGIVDQLSSFQLSTLVPSALPSPSGNRIQDVLNLGASIAGSAMMTLALVPETPFVIAQRICETLVQLLAVKLETLGCLKTHIVQLANVMTVLVQARKPAAAGLTVDLATVDADLLVAISQFTASRRSVNGTLLFDGSAFDRGRAALDAAANALMPKLPDAHQSVLALEGVLSAEAALPAPFLTPANLRLALSVVGSLVSLVQQEVLAVQAQTTASAAHLAQLRGVVTNYRATPAAQSVVALRLQTIATLLAKIQDLRASVRAARLQDATHATAPQIIDWTVGIRSVTALADQVRANELVEGAVDAGVAAILKVTYGGLIAAIDAINSPHVSKGSDNVTDLVASCLGICTQAQLLLSRMGDINASDSTLRTFQVLVANTAVRMNNRIGESQTAAVELSAACQPMLLLSIAARPSIDNLVSSMEQLGLDRGRDLLVSGQFSAFLGASFDDLSYLGSAIAALTSVMPGIDDAALRRQVSAIRDDLVGQKTNRLLSAADNVDFAGLRRTAAIKGEIATLQQNAQTISGILSYLKTVAAGLSLDVANIDPLNQAAMLPDVDALTVGAGGRLASALSTLAGPRSGSPAC